MRVILSILVFITIVGCSEKVTSNYKLSNPNFTKPTKDSIIFDISNTNSSLQLIGDIYLMEGECELILYDPHLDTLSNKSTERRIVYNQIFKAPSRINIDEQFDPSSGTYTLFYSLKALNGIAPNGNLKLEIINQY